MNSGRGNVRVSDMTNPPGPSEGPTSVASPAPPRRKNRLASILALGLIVAALLVGAGAWWQVKRAGAAYLERAAAYHAALTKVRTGLETDQPPDAVTRDWEAARVKEKDWEDHLSDADEVKDLTEHLRAASIMYGNAVLAHQKARETNKAETQPAATTPGRDKRTLLQNGQRALDLATQDLKK